MTKVTNLYELDAAGILNGIKEGKFNAIDVAQSTVDRIKNIESKIKAWKYFNEEKFIEEAKKLQSKKERNREIGKLFGVPIGVKDIFNTRDMPTCMGSPIWEGFTSGNDSRVVSYLKWADGIIAGKTVTAEFAVHYPGPTVNPHNYEYSPGTSSSGSAAAVASYMVPLALGTQTAGSTIRPASYCGIYGFKPSFGSVPRTGILKTLDTLDHVSMLARSIDDLEIIFNVMRVRGKNFPYIHETLDKYNRDDKQHNKWKVAFVKSPVWNEAENYAQDSIVNFVDKISNNNKVILKEVKLPYKFNRAHSIHETIYTKALSYYFQEEYEEHPDKISNMFKVMVERGRTISAEVYKRGLEDQNGLIHLLSSFFDEYDIIITLSTSSEAPKGLYTNDKKDSCLIWTLCHAPAINLPIFKSPNNMPFGAQIIAKIYKDYDLIEFARFLKEEGLIMNWKNS